MTVDRSRVFVLPDYQDLNKDQDATLALPLEGQHLIIGGPGTGKSVVALLRARRLAREGKRYLTLVYNKLLDQSNRHLFGKELSFNAKTWNLWVMELSKYFFKVFPTLPPKIGTFRPIDWGEMVRLSQITRHPKDLSTHYIVIDEGQDMPSSFYEFLANLGFENFYITADQNQQLDPDACSSRQDIQNVIGLEPREVIELTTNYRNTLPIAQLANCFYPDDKASPRVDLPPTTLSATTPELWHYGATGQVTLNDLAEKILRLSDRFPKKTIAILASNDTIREKFLNALHYSNPALDHGKPPIQTYSSGQKEPLDFGTGGIMVINAQSCKGLEFDIVILADIDAHIPKQNIRLLKSRFYVMITRAREQVILLRTGRVCPTIESLLPKDPKILIWK